MPRALRECDVRNGHLLVNRDKILDHMPRGGAVAEVGVALGHFTRKILDRLAPEVYYAIDTFGLHNYQSIWNIDLKNLFEGRDHIEYYAEKFKTEVDRGVLRPMPGLSWEVMEQLPDASLDLIYLDADHAYEAVKKDAEVALRKIKGHGYLVFNDYTMYDHLGGERYGVPQVVNDLCHEHDFEILFFALHPMLYCDVALRRKDAADREAA